MRGLRFIAAVAICLTTIAPATVGTFAQARIGVFVGPQTRDGFVDVDSGTLDSIKDIQDEIGKSPAFTLVEKSEQAKIMLLVARRQITTGGGGMAVGSVTVPFDRRSIETVIRVGNYEKTTVSESEAGGLWRGAARQVVKDLKVWAEANRAQLGK